MRTIQTTSQSRSPWPPRASPGFAPFVPGFGATPGYPWPPPPYPSLPFPYPINQVTQPTGGRGRSGQRGDSPSSPMSPGKGFGFDDRRRAWSPSFGGSPQPQPSGHQPARKAGSRRVAGVRTIRGRNENDETVVEPDLTVRYEVEEDKRQRTDKELSEEEDDEDDSFETGFIYHGTVAGAPVRVLYDIGAQPDDIFIDSKFAHLR
uniref:Uncharacterized protein n=1 Tax=Chromera velia CCMP2878 TaxID=1169474 RepID=A0A0G4I7G3_9ALVE|eukprot:Cvel_11655.t1-p1 / transcript=Cvel_11655.t1 / gene=Cvel_11655 / organism=Chromera_velia_CCMP2878 / gene_product=hypothetical protein / transcript_product=hypothetical protein / location=Cvel_scaffold739:8211-8822(-) / protein_length=204 / sequence_SO=supercontig / SO=protein_coding / is_pseudo=false